MSTETDKNIQQHHNMGEYRMRVSVQEKSAQWRPDIIPCS